MTENQKSKFQVARGRGLLAPLALSAMSLLPTTGRADPFGLLAEDTKPQAQEAAAAASAGSDKTEGAKASSEAKPASEGTAAGGEEKKTPFVDRSQMNHFLDSLSQTTRDTAKSKKETNSSMKSVLDLRLPRIDEYCDITVSHALLRLGYAFYAKFPGAEVELRTTAEALRKKTDDEYRGVTAKCHAELRAFAVSVLRVYLGADWSPDDEAKFNRAGRGKDEMPPPPSIRRRIGEGDRSTSGSDNSDEQ